MGVINDCWSAYHEACPCLSLQMSFRRFTRIGLGFLLILAIPLQNTGKFTSHWVYNETCPNIGLVYTECDNATSSGSEALNSTAFGLQVVSYIILLVTAMFFIGMCCSFHRQYETKEEGEIAIAKFCFPCFLPTASFFADNSCTTCSQSIRDNREQLQDRGKKSIHLEKSIRNSHGIYHARGSGDNTLHEEAIKLTGDCDLSTEEGNKTLLQDKSRDVHSMIVPTGADTTNGFRWREMTCEQIAILLAIYFTYLITWLNLSIPAPIFPKEANRKGVNATVSGWIFGVFALVQFIVSPFYRQLLSKFSSRTMLVLGLLVCGVCTISFGLLSLIDTRDGVAIYIILCFLVRILLAVACTVLSSTGLVMLVQYFPNNVATLFGIGEIFTGVGLVAGPALGGILYTTGGYIVPFAALGSVAILALPFFWLFVPQPQHEVSSNCNVEAEPNVGNTEQSMFRLLLHPKSIVNSVVIIVLGAAWTVLEPTLEPHLREHNIQPEIVGVLFLVMAAFYSITSPFWGCVADKIQETRIMIVMGLVLVVIGFLLLGPSPLLPFSFKYEFVWFTAVSLGIIGIANGICVVPTYSIYISVLREMNYPQNNSSYGMISGLFISMYALGCFIGPSLGGFLFDYIGFEWLVTCVAVACLLTGILVFVTLLVEKKCH